MEIEIELDKKWKQVELFVKERFDEMIDQQTILFIIGLQELGKILEEVKKEQKIDIIHIGICTVLGQYGYYQSIGIDSDGWPHFKSVKKIPNEGTDFQEKLMKKAIIDYFDLE